MSQYVIAALYKFVELDDFESLQEPLHSSCVSQNVLGTLLLAKEGINGTIAGSRAGINAVLQYLRSDPRLQDLAHKESETDSLAFYRMKVRLKKEIVTMGIEGINPSNAVGTYVAPSDWNDLISDPEVTLIDTRNDYEAAVGAFRNAINPDTTNFREFPEYVQTQLDPAKHKKVAMYCTGGIRCEKATAYLLSRGFKQVYHLQGGILKYLEEIPQAESLWLGECFVFDNRVTVTHDLEQGGYQQCHGCRRPISEADRQHPEYEEGVSCLCCYDKTTEQKKAAAAERHKQVRLTEERNQRHLGPQNSYRQA